MPARKKKCPGCKRKFPKPVGCEHGSLCCDCVDEANVGLWARFNPRPGGEEMNPLMKLLARNAKIDARGLALRRDMHKLLVSYDPIANPGALEVPSCPDPA